MFQKISDNAFFIILIGFAFLSLIEGEIGTMQFFLVMAYLTDLNKQVATNQQLLKKLNEANEFYELSRRAYDGKKYNE